MTVAPGRYRRLGLYLRGVERTDLPPPAETTFRDVDVEVTDIVPEHTLITRRGKFVARFADNEIIGILAERSC